MQIPGKTEITPITAENSNHTNDSQKQKLDKSPPKTKITLATGKNSNHTNHRHKQQSHK
jgi:hypothetical protein